MDVDRLPRGTRKDAIRVGYVIEQARKDRLAELARNAHVTASFFLERVIAHLDSELDEHGVPKWWSAEDDPTRATARSRPARRSRP